MALESGMMRRTGFVLTTALIVAALGGGAGEAAAQQADGWWDWALPQLVDVRGSGQTIIPLPRGDQRTRGNARAQQGPKFCQNGQGHPVHGRQWCRDKGFGGGVFDGRWDNRGWDDVIFRAPRGTDRRRGAVDQGGLIDILGDVVFGRLVSERSQIGATGPMTGRWIQADGASVLQIRAGGVPLAELTDLNGNGRADAVLVTRRR
jgi:hypothetical protein